MKKIFAFAAVIIMLAANVTAQNISTVMSGDYETVANQYFTGKMLYSGVVAAQETLVVNNGNRLWITLPFTSITDTVIVVIEQSPDLTNFDEAVRDTVLTTATRYYLLDYIPYTPFVTIRLEKAGSDTTVAGPVHYRLD